MMKRGKITGFEGNWGSGMATLWVDGAPIPCDNAATVRALDAIFGDVIAPGHCVNTEALVGREILWDWDDMGLMLGALGQVGEE